MNTVMQIAIFIVVCVSNIAAQTESRDCADAYECQQEVISSETITCSGYYGCDEATITATNGLIDCSGTNGCNNPNGLTTDFNVYCSGFKSCYSETANINAGIIQCLGSHSCKNPNVNEFTLLASVSVVCSALESCKDTTIQADKFVYCEGDNACVQSTITADDMVYCDGNAACLSSELNTMSVSCSSQYACKGATINADEIVQFYGYESGTHSYINSAIIEAYGYKSLQNAQIDSDGLKKVNIKLFGSESGTNAVIDCRDGSQCNLFCKNSACHGLTFNCESNAICSISPIICLTDEMMNGNISPNGIHCPIFQNVESSSIPNHRSILIFKKTTDDYQPELQLQPQHLSCNGERECASQNITDSVVNCGGSQSCLSTNIMQSQDLNTDEIINCFGSESCGNSVLKSKNGLIACYGNTSCVASEIVGKNIQCMAYQACKSATRKMIALGNLKCAGTAACLASKSKSYKGTQCKSCHACYGSELVESKQNIECSGHYSCARSILSADNCIQCLAKGSCHNCVLTATNILYVYGYIGAAYSTISAPDIRGLAYHSLAFATIDSENINSEEIKINSFAHLSGYGALIICRANKQCTLTCKGSGCKKLDLICVDGSNCIVLPHQCSTDNYVIYQGIDCPNILNDLSQDELVSFQEKRKESLKNNDQIYNILNDEIDEFQYQFDELLQNDESNEQVLLFENNKYKFISKPSIIDLKIFCAIFAIFMLCSAIILHFYRKNIICNKGYISIQ